MGSSDIEELFYSAIAIAGASACGSPPRSSFPPDAFVDALCESAGHGVDVRIPVNGPEIDKEIVRRAGQPCYDRLLRGGVRTFEYQRTMLHAKTLLVDGTWASVGSNNFSNRSLALSSELAFSLSDQRIVAELEEHFRDDLRSAEEFDLTAWRSRPLRRRAVERATVLVREQF